VTQKDRSEGFFKGLVFLDGTRFLKGFLEKEVRVWGKSHISSKGRHGRTTSSKHSAYSRRMESGIKEGWLDYNRKHTN